MPLQVIVLHQRRLVACDAVVPCNPAFMGHWSWTYKIHLTCNHDRKKDPYWCCLLYTMLLRKVERTILSSGLPANCFTFLFIFISSFCLHSVLESHACSSIHTAYGIITVFLAFFILSFCLHQCSPFCWRPALVLVAFYSPKQKSWLMGHNCQAAHWNCFKAD